MWRVRSMVRVSVIAVVITAASLPAQTLPPAFTKARAERDGAMRNSDAKVYGRYTIDEFVVVMPDGSIQTKADRMAIMSKTTNTPAQPEAKRDERITVAGTDTIILNWIAPIQGNAARFTEVWVKIGKEWQVAGAHVSMMQNSP